VADTYDPKYDEDQITYGYLKKILGEDTIKNITSSSKVTICKNYGSMPSPPYEVGDTWTTSSKIYKCIKSRSIGSFNMSDWIEYFDKETNEVISSNFQFLSSVDLQSSSDNKIETYYQEDDPSTNWSDEEKQSHVGDYYQNSTDYKTYIYTLDNGNFSWVEKEVTSIIFEPYTGHRNIFLKKPSSYNENDIWKILSSEDAELLENIVVNDFLKANSGSDSFDVTHWKKITNELSIKANLYSSAGIMILSEKLLTNLQYTSSGRYNGYELLGYNEYITRDGHTKNYADISIDVDLPDNFVIISAYLTIFHTPVYWSYYDLDSGTYGDNWGYSRNIKLYKSKDDTNFKLYMAFANEYRYEINSSDLEEITNAFKVSSYNPTNQSDTSIESKGTINLKSYLNSTGKTKLILRSGNDVPTTSSEVTKQTGMARAIINILGYVDPSN